MSKAVKFKDLEGKNKDGTAKQMSSLALQASLLLMMLLLAKPLPLLVINIFKVPQWGKAPPEYSHSSSPLPTGLILCYQRIHFLRNGVQLLALGNFLRKLHVSFHLRSGKLSRIRITLDYVSDARGEPLSSHVVWILAYVRLPP